MSFVGIIFFFSSRRRHTRWPRDWSSDVCSSDLAVLAIYAGLDDRINQSIPAIEAAMQKHGKTFRKIVYPNVNHAFHNDTGERYNAAAAKAAWGEALAWFEKYL